MSASYLPDNERDSQMLRASVMEAAMSLGTKVTDWILDNSAFEEGTEGGYQDEMPTPGLHSSASSEESHSFGFSSHDGHSGAFTTNTISRSHLQISLPQALGSDAMATLENSYYLDSPFVMINEGHFPTPDVLAFEQKSVPRKKSIRNFRFGKKRSRNAVSIPDMKQLTISAPRPLLPFIDDPALPSLVPDSRGTTPDSSPLSSTAPSNSSRFNTPRTTPTKRRKQVQQHRDWDFKDPDRPSFFLEQYESDSEPIQSRHGTGVKRSLSSGKSQYDTEDTGYVSEGTGLRFRSRKGTEERKLEKTGPLKRSMTDRIRQKWSSADVRDADPLFPKSISASLPLYERFARKQSQLRSPASTNTRRRSTSASFTSSFALLPDLNAAKRLGLDKYTSDRDGGASGIIGADNEVKLEMLAKLIDERPLPTSTVTVNARKNLTPLAPTTIRPLPPLLNTAPLPQRNEYSSPSSAKLPVNTVLSSPMRGRDSPFPLRAQRAQSPVRGREAPFPTKPVLRTTPRSKTLSPQLLVPPQRYLNLDVPRSVRSTFTKDMDLEEDTHREGRENKPDEGNDDDDLSVYSKYAKVMDEDAESRASFMDPERSEAIRAILLRELSDFNKGSYF